MATKPMPDFIRAKIEERKAAKAAREAEEAGEEPEVEEPEEEDEGEESEGEESEDEEDGAHEAERGPAPLRKNGLAALRKNGASLAAASSSAPSRRRRRSFDPGRSFDDAAKWVMKNKVPVLIGLGVVGLFWLASKGKKTSPRYAYGVKGTFTDLAEKIGQQSDPPWTPSGSDLDVRTAQYYLNKVAGAGLREDGILGKQTAAALKKFQRGNGLPETGAIDDETGNALEYFFFATSPLPKLKASAVLSPGSIASLEEQAVFRSDLPLPYAPYGPVTYSPYPMPPQYDGVTYSPYPMSPPPMSPPARPGKQVASAPKRLKSTARQPGSKTVAPSYATGGDFRTGIQSTSMYDPRFYDYPDYMEAYWDPIPE